jgi:hypothetical protein
MSHPLPFRTKCVLFASVALVASVGSSCNLDPVHRAGVNGLGAEEADLYPPESEFHRPGEPCALCHSRTGPADGEFVLAGTVFWGPNVYEDRVDQAYVRIKDARRTTRCFVTNCNGNFFVRPEDFPNLTFPLLVSVERTKAPGRDDSTLVNKAMASHIGREPSCATCHIQGLRDFGSPGQIRLFDDDGAASAAMGPRPACPPAEEDLGQIVTRCPEDR